MPAQKQPTAVLEARGAFKNHPERRPEGEPVVTTPLGPPPHHLEVDQIKCWNELAETAPNGVLTSADRQAMEQCACLLAEMREDFKAMPVVKLKQLTSILGMFGMTPADRSKLNIQKPKDASSFSNLS